MSDIKKISAKDFLSYFDVQKLLWYIENLDINTSNFKNLLERITIDYEEDIINLINIYYTYDELKYISKKCLVSQSTKSETIKAIIETIKKKSYIDLYSLFGDSIIEAMINSLNLNTTFKIELINDILSIDKEMFKVLLEDHIFFTDLKDVYLKLYSLKYFETKHKLKKDIIEAILDIIIFDDELNPINSDTDELKDFNDNTFKEKDVLKSYLSSFKIKASIISSEKDAEYEIKKHLLQEFPHIKSQYYVGGNFGAKIDLDINNGGFGIEIKLTSSLLKTTSEIFRVIGQSLYYKKRVYNNNFLIVFAGYDYDNNKPAIKELFELLSEYNIEYICVEMG